MIQTINNNNLGDAVNKEVAVLDFAASWCGPCKMLAPVFHEVAEEMGENISFYTADIDQNMDLAQSFKVTSVPTLVLLKNGKEAARSMGFHPKEALRTWIKNNA